MEHEGNGFNDTYKTSEGNTTLDEPMATGELPVEQRLFLGWSFGKGAFIKYVGIISGILDPSLFLLISCACILSVLFLSKVRSFSNPPQCGNKMR